MIERIKNMLAIIAILLLSYWAVEDILKPGFFPMHDDTQVVRVYEMTKALKTGQFPIRWVPDLGYGYGYAIFNFYSPLPYYFGGFFNLLGFDALAATKIMFVFGTLLSGASMYFFAKEFWGKWGGVLSALLYVYAPYHLLDIYVRGAVGEFWAIAFLPLVFHGVYKIYSSGRVRGPETEKVLTFGPGDIPKWVIFSAFSFAAVILSHNITAMLLSFFLAIAFPFLILTTKDKKQFAICYLLFSILGLLLSAFFWLPAVSESTLTKVATLVKGTNDFHFHFVCISQLWNSPWNFGGSVPGCNDGLSFQIGKFHLIYALIGFLAIIFFVKSRKIRDLHSSLIIISLFLLIFSIFMLLPVSNPIWNLIPLLAYTQYPWRFLAFVILFVSFFSGATPLFLKEKSNYIKALAVVFLVFLPIIKDYKFTKPRYISPWTEKDYITEENIKWKTSKISDEYLPKDFPIPQSTNDICWASGNCDEKRITVAKALLQNTTVRKTGNLISLLGLLATLLLLVKNQSGKSPVIVKKNRNYKPESRV